MGSTQCCGQYAGCSVLPFILLTPTVAHPCEYHLEVRAQLCYPQRYHVEQMLLYAPSLMCELEMVMFQSCGAVVIEVMS